MIKRYNDKILVCGIDEAGRGAFAGPVTVSAVILPKNYYNPEIKDSKKLSDSKKNKLFDEIKEVALDYIIFDVNNNQIDDLNVLQATFLGMNRSIEKLVINPKIYLIDGNKFITKKQIKYKCIIGGDDIYQSIAAASILSKVHRDNVMKKIDNELPEFNWKKNKGYGTKEHIKKIKKFGLSKYHRKSFKIKNKQLTLNV
tara:strand:+ start:512 stop:1108 length:597 start_codon:yes stop_codon:yes gene_type:complete